ncbi:hypothetical protein B0H17DRAFT_1244169, partial [Mycena rosella]
ECCPPAHPSPIKNYVPCDTEISEIHALFVEPTRELAHVDAQIDEMEIVMCQLKTRRASLQTAIDDHRALTSPIRHIPRDILLEMFFSCLPISHNALIDPRRAAILLGHVAGIGEMLRTPRRGSGVPFISRLSTIEVSLRAWL